MEDLAEYNPIRIVIAEDEGLIRMDLTELLEEEGFVVEASVSNGLEAIEAVREHRPDVCLLDIKMPKMDGISAASELKDEVAIVFLTAFSQKELISKASEAGAQAYLIKPFSRADVLPALELAVARFREGQEKSTRILELEQKIEERKIIEIAKGRLIDLVGMSEQEAFKFLRNYAMNERLSMFKVSKAIIAVPEEQLKNWSTAGSE